MTNGVRKVVGYRRYSVGRPVRRKNRTKLPSRSKRCSGQGATGMRPVATVFETDVGRCAAVRSLVGNGTIQFGAEQPAGMR